MDRLDCNRNFDCFAGAGIASEFADKTIVTDDNPRNEVPSEIRKMILAGCPDATEIEGREIAINSAMDNLQEGDTLLIAGKGHEDYQIFADRTIHFDDAEQAAKAVAELQGGV